MDSGPALSYTLHLDTNSQGMFGIHRYGGGVSLTGPLDYEEKTWYTLTIRSSDSKHQSEANLTVLVDDVNDNAPTFTQDLYQVLLPSHTCRHTGMHTLFQSICEPSGYIFMLCFHHQVTVSEHLPAGSAVITVTATDRDSGENGKITYRVVSSTRGVFYIDPNNGKITVCTFMALYSHFLTRAPP